MTTCIRLTGLERNRRAAEYIVQHGIECVYSDDILIEWHYGDYGLNAFTEYREYMFTDPQVATMFALKFQ